MPEINQNSAKTIEKPGWSCFKAGIALKNIHDEVLLVKEAKISVPQPDGTEQLVASNDGKWKLPCGYLREQDTYPDAFEGAASSIGTKLSCYDFDVHGICHIGFCRDDLCLTVIYAADQPYFVGFTDPPDPEKVAAVCWFSYSEILQLKEEGALRDPELTLAAVENACKGFTVPEEIVATYPSRSSLPQTQPIQPAP